MKGVGGGGSDGEIRRERRAVILIGAHNEPGFPPKRGFNLPFPANNDIHVAEN